MLLTKRGLLLSGAASLAAGAGPRAPAWAQAPGTPKVLRYALTTMPNVIDPHFSTGFQVRDVTYAVFDTLFAVNDRYEPQPQMVESWTASPDGMAYRFILREGLRWHDGAPVTAEDCVLSIRRWWARDAMGSLLRAATGRLEPLDDKGFELVLHEPFAFVLDALGKPGSNVPAMLPKRLAQLPPTQPIRELVGSGPFRYLPGESLSDQRLVFERNAAYVPRAEPPIWASGGKVVKVDRLEILAIPDPSTQWGALLGGEVDYIERLSPDLVPLLRTTGRGKVRRIHETPVQIVVRVNHLQPPFSNLLARRALLLALDQRDVVDATAGDPEGGRTCPALFGCGGPYASDAGAPKADMAQAKALLAQAVALGGVDLRKPVVQLLVGNDPTVTPAGQVVAQALRDLGFALDQQVVDFATFAQRRLKTGPVEDGGWNVGNTTVGTTELANPLVSQPIIASGAAALWGWPDSAEVEALRRAFSREGDPARRKQLAAEIQAEAYRHVTYIPGGEILTTSAIGNRVRGALDAPMAVFWNIEV